MRFIKKLSPPRTLVFGFGLIITLGGVLLSLPICSRSGTGTPMIDAVFTAASAVCVTGLTVYDTWAQFSPLGQAVILLLIQLGGLGFMTFGVLFSMALGRRIGLWERTFLMESVGAGHLSGIVRLVKRILRITLIFEGSGALLLCLRFIPRMGFVQGLWFSLFHSVSAFCNAGFDIMGFFQPGASLAPFATDPLVLLPLMVLIVCGGLGFIVWDDLLRTRRFSRLTLHSRVMLSMTATVLVGAALLFRISESNGVLSSLTQGQKILTCLFQSVTPRTAGFCTFDQSTLSNAGILLTTLLMIFGAGTGSTAGGVKLSTIAVLLAAARSQFSAGPDVNLMHRCVDPRLVFRAIGTLFFYLILALTGAFLIALAEPLPLKQVLFESFSAIGTVGLSLGITAKLCTFSKCVLIALMFAGRLGSLTLLWAVSMTPKNTGLHNPSEMIVVE